MASRKGIPNKMGASAKENVVAVFTRLGGTAQMANWAKDNLTDFYRLYAKLIPQELSGTIELAEKRLSYAERIEKESAGLSNDTSATSVVNTLQ